MGINFPHNWKLLSVHVWVNIFIQINYNTLPLVQHKHSTYKLLGLESVGGARANGLAGVGLWHLCKYVIRHSIIII